MAKVKGANTTGVTKTRMVEEAMDALGDPGPKEIQEYVRQKYGEELKYTMAASYKSQINKKRGGGAKRGGTTAPSGPVDLKDVAAVKALYDRLGAAKLNDILKLFK
jgi:hypothetical protein